MEYSDALKMYAEAKQFDETGIVENQLLRAVTRYRYDSENGIYLMMTANEVYRTIADHHMKELERKRTAPTWKELGFELNRDK
jgi:hypothetical protein